MTWYGIQPWQLPIFVTIAIVVLEFVGDIVLRTSTSPEVRRNIRTVGLALLAVLTVVIAVMAIGTSTADSLSSIGAFILAAVTLVLSIRSYLSPRPEPEPVKSEPVVSEPVKSGPAAAGPDERKPDDQVS